MLELYLFGVGVVLGAVINDGFFSLAYDVIKSMGVEQSMIGIAGILLVLLAALAWPILLAVCVCVGIARSLKN